MFDVKVVGSFHETTDYQKHGHRFTFCTVRNPYSRAVSRWHFARNHLPELPASEYRWQLREASLQQPFDVFTQEYLLQPVSETVADARIDHIIRFENYANDIRRLPFSGMQSVPIPHKNKSPVSDWREFYRDQPDLIAFMQEYYAADFERFGYPLEPF